MKKNSSHILRFTELILGESKESVEIMSDYKGSILLVQYILRSLSQIKKRKIDNKKKEKKKKRKRIRH